MRFSEIERAAAALQACGLLKEVPITAAGQEST
jgi:hypothetical protein